MSSSDSSSDDEQFNFVPHESIKDVLTIIHKGKPSKEPQLFAKSTTKKLTWPNDLWDSGTLIYNIEDPKINLPPPLSRSDKILRFNSKFESGNLRHAYQLSQDSYHLILEYDKNKSGSCQWYYFQIKNVRKDVKYTFYISGFHKSTSIEKSGLKVFWYSEKRAKEQNISWSRGGYNYEYGVTQRDENGKRASLQFKIIFPYDDDTVYLCYALPYTYSDLQRYIINWTKQRPDIFTSSIFCKTLGGRDCPLITITKHKENVIKNDYLVFSARVHPGESNGSVVLHGLIDFLLSDHPAARYLVDKFVIKIIPMLNIDGVVEGNYRIGLSGVDLNRVWTKPDPFLHPVITTTKKLIKDLSINGNISVYIDFHGHSRLNGSFAYGCPNDTDFEIKSLVNTEKILPRIISFLSDAFSWGSCKFSFPKERKDASRIVIRKEFNVVQSFTIESSFGGIVSGPRSGVLYDELVWKELGAKCGEGVYHLVTKDTSPLAAYVIQEIQMITPINNLENDNEDYNENFESEPDEVTVNDLAITANPVIKSKKKEQKNLIRSQSSKTEKKMFWKPKETDTKINVIRPKTKQLRPIASKSLLRIEQNDNECHEDLEIEYMNQRRNGKFSSSTLFHMMKPKKSLVANSKIISTQPPGYVSPKWSVIEFTKR